MKTQTVALAIVVVFGLFMVGSTIVAFWPTRIMLQVTTSPDKKHTVRLARNDAIDRNYSIRLDGKVIYRSPDFSPRRDIPYREALLWDNTGHIVVLEVARHRIFGYDVQEGRRLGDDELLAVELSPEPPLWEYYFESEWPGIGRATRHD